MTNLNRPKVSIAIPTFNRVNYLKLAVESSLSQTYSNVEIIISDNASTDKTAEILAQYSDSRLVTIRQPTNVGMMANWNKCLEIATGKYFILLSDDDLLDSSAIEQLVARFEDPLSYNCKSSSNEIGVVYCRSRIINQNGETIALGKIAASWASAPAAIDAFFKLETQPVPCSILMRTDDVRTAGGYDASGYPLIADAKVWMTVALNRGTVGFIEDIHTSYRVHPISTTNSVSIEEWMRNNQLLANFCSGRICSLGNSRLANDLLRRINWFNAHVAASQIEADSTRLYIPSIQQYLYKIPLFLSLNSTAVVFYRLLRLIIPKSILTKIKSVKIIYET